MMCSCVALKHGHREPEQAVKKAKGILNINRESRGTHLHILLPNEGALTQRWIQMARALALDMCQSKWLGAWQDRRTVRSSMKANR